MSSALCSISDLATTGKEIVDDVIATNRQLISEALKDLISSYSNDREETQELLSNEINKFRAQISKTEILIAESKNELDNAKNRSKSKDENEKKGALSTTALELATFIIEDLEGTVEIAKLVSVYLNDKVVSDPNLSTGDIQTISHILKTVTSVYNRHMNIIRNIKTSAKIPLGSTERFRHLLTKLEKDYKSIEGFRLAERKRMEEWINISPERRELWAKWGKKCGIVLGIGSAALGVIAICLLILTGPIGWTGLAAGAVTMGIGSYYCNKYANTSKAIQQDQHFMRMRELRKRIHQSNISLSELQNMLDMCNHVVADKWKQLDCVIDVIDPCAICHEVFTDTECKDQINNTKHMVTPSICNHKYHRICLLRVVNTAIQQSLSPLCPYCRKIFMDITPIRI